MNNPSPFAPQSSNPEQKIKSRARVRLAVYCIISVHVVGLMALLMIGCRKPQADVEPTSEVDTNQPSMELGTPADVVDQTNPPAVQTSAPPVIEPVQPIVPPAPAPVGQEYTIVKGDSFATIAKKFPGVTVKAIQEANPTVQPTKLKIGQKIQIPPPSVAAPSASGVTPLPDASGAEVYTVKSGDTLTTIAKKFPGVTVKAIRTANNLTTDKIRVGQKLTIPAKPAPVAPAPAEPLSVPAPAPATPGHL
jgi:LysM repeat protein